MSIQENGFYIIDDQYFKDFEDPFLKRNDAENRPHYYCFKEEGTSMFWLIPLSFQVDKCKKEIEKKRQENKRCDYYYILKIAGRESAFLISDMFPITEKYIKREYTLSNIPVKLLDKHHISEIGKRAKRIYNLIHRGIKLHDKQPDVLKIKAKLIADESREEIQETAKTDE